MNNYKPYGKELTTTISVKNLKFDKKYFIYLDYDLIDEFDSDDEGNFTGPITLGNLVKGDHTLRIADSSIYNNIEWFVDKKIAVKDDMSNENISTLRSINVDNEKQGIFQSFFINEDNGITITSLNLYFRNKPLKSVNVKLRKIIDEKVSEEIIPGSSVNVDTADITIDDKTLVTFDYPIFLETNQEYCIHVLVDDNIAELYTQQYGVVTDTFDNIVKNEKPQNVGSLFNYNKKWNRNNTKSISFDVNKALFDTSLTGNINFKVNNNEEHTLPYNSLFTTDGSNILKVFNVSNFNINDRIVISGTGITELDDEHTITSVGDNYIETDNYSGGQLPNFTETKYFGGNSTKVNKNISFNTSILNINSLELDETVSDYSIRSTDYNRTINADYLNVYNKKVNEFENKKILLDDENTNTNLNTLVDYQIKTFDANISPLIDISNVNLFLLDDKIEGSVYLSQIITPTSQKNKVQLNWDTIKTSAADYEVYLLLDGVEILIDNPVYSQTSTQFINYNYLYEGVNFSNCQLKIAFKGTESAVIKNLKLKIIN